MRLVLSGSASIGVKDQEELHGLIGVEKPEFLLGFPKLRMEPVPLREIEMDFGLGEKVFVILHGLPVLDYKVHLRFGAVRGAQTLHNYKGHVWAYMPIVLHKIKKGGSEIWRKKEGSKKERKFRL